MEKIQSWLYTYISNIDPEFKKLKPSQYLSLNFFTDTSLDSMALMSLILDAEKNLNLHLQLKIFKIDVYKR